MPQASASALNVLPAALGFALAAGLAMWVGLQRPRNTLHQSVLGLLGCILLWDGGIVWAMGAGGPEGPAIGGIHLILSGANFLPAIYLLLVGQMTGVPIIADRPRAAIFALATPGALALLSWYSNPWHGLYHAPLGPTYFESPAAGAGPLYWVALIFGYTYIAIGMTLSLRAALRARDPIQRSQLHLLWLGALAPVIGTAIQIFELLPLGRTPIPISLGLAGLVLATAIVRFRFLETLPLSLADVVDHLSDGLLLADPHGRITKVSHAAERLLERPADQLLGRSIEDAIRHVDPTRATASWLLESPGDEPSVRMLRTPSDRAIELHHGCVLDADGARLGRFLLLGDRTERDRYERLRQQTQRLQSLRVLAAGIGHEINNPLAFVRANLSHLREMSEALAKAPPADAPLIDELHEVLEDTLSGLDRIGSIVASTRSLSRDAPSADEPVDLNEVVAQAVRVAAWHPNRAAMVELRTDASLPSVRGSAEQLGQVVLNLLINAKQALADRSDGRIWIETESARDQVLVHVRDNGPGIEPGSRERVFDPFFTTKPPDEGTGLGLSIAHDLVDEHGGGLEVREWDGGGTVFTIRLPAAATAPRSARGHRRDAAGLRERRAEDAA